MSIDPSALLCWCGIRGCRTSSHRRTAPGGRSMRWWQRMVARVFR